MSDIFEEVDESIRQDKIETAWKRYRLFVYGGAALLIGAVALNEFVLHPHFTQIRAERAQAFERAATQLADGDYAEAEADFRTLVDEESSLSPLAANYLAQTVYEGSGDAAGATDVLAGIGKADGTPFERAALLKAAYAKADTASLTELETLLGDLKDEESGLGALARELIAAKAYAEGDAARARTAYNRLKFDAAAPQGVVRRADIALAAIPIPAETAPAAPAEEAAPAEASETTEETGQ
ncbi:hypothetical protein [uncultured Hyphomonas sp.]|uniref:hypothetical protein n=1 Tax=uncultured Hyphomonas sp. TaxID=225298 RepID=UPI002AAC422B|nr:hypothetical protein [uncultured Hyphomonas sp.]